MAWGSLTTLILATNKTHSPPFNLWNVYIAFHPIKKKKQKQNRNNHPQTTTHNQNTILLQFILGNKQFYIIHKRKYIPEQNIFWNTVSNQERIKHWDIRTESKPVTH